MEAVRSKLPLAWIPVASSNLSAVAYVEELRQLYIFFTSADIYVYFNVPPSIYRGLMAASSKGKYFHQHIRGRFAFQKL